jgi:3-oxoacyl-(acyl-carrier-protein) synthase
MTIYVNDIELMDANGNSLDECVGNYLNGRLAISKSNHHLSAGLPVYALTQSEDQIDAELNSFGCLDTFYSFSAKLALLSAIKISMRNKLLSNTAVICVTLEGAQHSKMAIHTAFSGNKKRISAKMAATCTPSSICTFVSRNLKLTGPSLVINQACSAFISALDYAKYLLESNTVDNVLLIGVETSSYALNMYVFKSAGVLTEGNIKPFDQLRSGTALGDAAVCWLLSSHKTDKSLAKINKISLYSDHYHLTSHDPNGSAVKFLINNLVNGPVDSVNCHATGTVVGDDIEMFGLKQFLTIPTKLYALKSFTGHCLASSAGVEMSYSIAGMNDGWIPYTPLTDHPIDTGHHSLILNKPLRQVNNNFVKLSFGFGGVSGGVLIEKANT